MMNDQTLKRYTEILKEQLVPAMGCTEPVSVAYAAAKVRELLGAEPQSVRVQVSRNIIKNAKSVVVPHTGGLKGIEAAVAAGIMTGDAALELDVLSRTKPEQYAVIKKYLERGLIKVEPLATDALFDMILTGEALGQSAVVRISGHHTNVTYLEKDGEVLYRRGESAGTCAARADDAADQNNARADDAAYPELVTADILDYIRHVPIDMIAPMIERQIMYNQAISEEGLAHDYGANIGSVLMTAGATPAASASSASGASRPSVRTRAKAAAAAGSDARMSGCEMPVIIVCGSGNQGITASLPIVEYAKEYDKSREELIRAVALSDLMAVHVKDGIGTLSAFCGAVCAGCGAGAGIAYLLGGNDSLICHTFVNALAIVSGMICDGAKPSCAAKIAASVDAGLLGYEMACQGQEFYSGEGIITKGIEGNIRNIGRLGRFGMKQTDEEIMNIMFNMENC